MIVKKKLNNNVVLAEDAHKSPMIVMGKGIGYKAFPGDTVKEAIIDHTFILKADDEITRVSALFQEIPIEIILLADKIIHQAQVVLECDFGTGVLISLADHIFSAMKRQQQAIPFTNPLKWDIKRLYVKEAQVGEEAVKLIQEEIGIQFDENEATAIAMHFISAGNSYRSMKQAMDFTKIISEIITIIQYHFQVQIDENTISFSRLVTHLQYFLLRQVEGVASLSVNDEMMHLIIKQYSEAFKCAEKVITFLKQSYHLTTSLEEEVYLTLHIQRVIEN